MHIQIKKIKWKNLLSYGNEWTELDLTRARTTLIIGPNGSGKTSWLDFLTFALYKKAYRDINIPQLLNSINKKNGLVELEFDVGSKQYLIRRGINPDVFDIYQDGILLKKPAKILEYQETLQKIIKINHKAFCQIVILGTTDFVPFMKLETYKRREIIENLLDIQIFSVMGNILKTRMDQTKSNITEVDSNIRLEEKKVELHKKHVAELQQNNQDLVEVKQKKIEEFKEKIEKCNEVIKDLSDELIDLNVGIADQNKIERKFSTIKELDRNLKNKLSKIKKDVEFYSENDSCPTCLQEINYEFKDKTVGGKILTIREIEEALSKLEVEYKSVNDRLKEINEINKTISKVNGDITRQNNEIFSCNKLIESSEEEIERLKKTTTHIDDNVDELKKVERNLVTIKNQKNSLIQQRSVQDVCAFLLKDSGIKAKIIKQYVPIINKLINKYLATMDFFVNFEIDEKFEETIKSRHRDEFSYGSFSEGEKDRLNLAILFAWRTIGRMRNSTSTNILVMDEVFDGSMDIEGTEKLLEIIKSYDPDVNIFMISHKKDMADQFDRVIRTEKIKNFSQMEESA